MHLGSSIVGTLCKRPSWVRYLLATSCTALVSARDLSTTATATTGHEDVVSAKD